MHAVRPAEEAPPIGLVISMEGADPILEPDDLDDWWDAGLRIMGLSHYGNGRYSHGTDSPGPLHPPADALLTAMERRGMILDVTHLADLAMDQVFDRFGGVVLASHHNCRALVDRQRQLRDDDIRRIAGRGGVIGAAMDNWMLDPDCGQTGSGVVRRAATLGRRRRPHRPRLPGHRLGAPRRDRHRPRRRVRLRAVPASTSTRSPTSRSSPPCSTAAATRRADVEAIMHGNWLDLMQRAWTDARERPDPWRTSREHPVRSRAWPSRL